MGCSLADQRGAKRQLSEERGNGAVVAVKGGEETKRAKLEANTGPETDESIAPTT